MNHIPSLDTMRQYFLSGATKSIDFRKGQLKKLKEIILKYGEPLNDALYQDLRKSKEEIWITETGWYCLKSTSF
ncbi:hypothetical protein [Niabella ginsengisoli]|uniref:Uncharacterized protein n=1 Tax=Niabella ginsengisoli TaxID=522298 RepID=A0ABS9SP29_9BACT|nr:hypothetical protein [Niabella ginsengisoli]MCH5600117.1 hypothetical protein [Niabella ginsengisoli]